MFLVDRVLEDRSFSINAKVRSFCICILASFLIALFAKLRIYLPFSPIPIVLQMQIVFALALFLGPKKAAFTVVLFLAQGAIGLPVFSGLGLFSVSGGYLLGYFFAAIAIGKLIEHRRTYMGAFLAVTIGQLIVYLCDISVLYCYLGLKSSIIVGIVPFCIPDLFKNLLLIKFLKSAKWAEKACIN